MFKQDYIILIINCHKYRFKALQQKLTWLPKISSDIIYFHVLGDPKLTKDYLFLEDDNLLLVKVDDDYNSLPKKVIRAYQAILNTYEFKYIFKTDDDQQVTNIKIFDTIRGSSSKVALWWQYCGCKTNISKPISSHSF